MRWRGNHGCCLRLPPCRARLSAFIRGRTAVRDDADDILQGSHPATDEGRATGGERGGMVIPGGA